MEIQSLEGAFWCDGQRFSDWNVLPVSAFDRERKCPDRMLEFRTMLDYSGEGKFSLRFTAGCRFRMLINGRFAEDGPVEAGGDYGKTDAPDWWFYDEMEIARFLHPGRNTLLFQLIPAGMCQMDYSLGFPWLWCAVKRQGKWEPVPAENWEFRIHPFYRSRSLQDYTAQDRFPWEFCCQRRNVPLRARFLALPRLTSKRRSDFRILFPFGRNENIRARGKKIHARPGDGCTFFLEFSEERCGHFELDWNGTHDVVLKLDFEERYGSPGKTETVRTSQGTGTYRTILIYPFRYVQITLLPSDFRTPDPAGECIFSFRMYERHFPVGSRKSLKTEDECLRKIDDICLRNVVMCMQRMHLDSPVHLEGLGCTGDYRIEARAEYAAFGESRLARADLIRTALLLRQQRKMFHTTYALCYVLMFGEYVQFTNDRNFLKEYYDTLKIVYDCFHAFTGRSGLLSEAENYLFIDWVTTGKYTYHHPPASRGMGAMTALWYGALRMMAEMAEMLRLEKDSKNFAGEADQVREAFNRELWDAERECYRDGIPGLSKRKTTKWLPEEDGEVSATSLTSVMALAYGLPGKAQEPERLLERVINGELPLRPSVYYMFYLFEAVIRYNVWEKYGRRLVYQWKVFLRSGLRESWHAGDYSHAWGAAPSVFLRETERR